MLLKRYFLVEQLQREARTASRKAVERVPEGQNTWKPHERSMELGYLAALVATMPGWPALMIDRDKLDLNDPSGARFLEPRRSTRAPIGTAAPWGSTKASPAPARRWRSTTEEPI